MKFGPVRILFVAKMIAVFFATFYLAALVLLYVNQSRILFPAPPFDSRGFDDEVVVWINTPDGERLRSLFFPAKNSQGTVIFFHGNGSAAQYEVSRVDRLIEQGFSVMLAEYRGYGGSSGSPSEEGLIADGLATYDWVKANSQGPVFLYAHSLGSGVAVAVAAQREVQAMVLEAAYSSIADVAAEQYWMFPVRLLIRNPINSMERINKVTAPALFIHGGKDALIDQKFGEKLYQSADEPKIFSLIPDAGHNDLLTHGSLQKAIDHFTSP